MQLHLLLTTDIAMTMPSTCKTIQDYGSLVVRFDNGSFKRGIHCIVEDTTDNIVKWLRPFDAFVRGSGSPIMESFSMQHISDEYIVGNADA